MTGTALIGRNRRIDPLAVNGWGADADPRNDPTYPMRDRGQNSTVGMTWDRPTQQRPTVEVLRSIEHNRLPAVTGTSAPPSGVSGAVRRLAFRYSESDWTHWLMLMGADRINAVEGVVADLARGRIPNVPAEMGLGAAWRHDPRGVAVKAATTVALAAVAVALVRRARRSRRA